MNRFGILSTLTRPARTWCRHAVVRLQRRWFDNLIRKRIAKKLDVGLPIRVVFVIHEPRSYSALAMMIDAMKADTRFKVTILAVHYRHGVFSDNDYHDGGAAEFLRNHGIPFEIGSDVHGNFRDLKKLEPDIIVFQTPYNQFLFPSSYAPKEVSRYAFLAYTPYDGISLSDRLNHITHTPYFFQYVRYAFMGSDFDCTDLIKRIFWCKGLLKVYNSGCPKFEYALSTKYDHAKSAWTTSAGTVRRVLWTPRWNPEEGTSHFFAYWEELLNWSRENKGKVEFVFRPHPLMFNQLLKTGKLTEEAIAHIRDEFAKTANAHIDESDEYQHTFLGADCLIADPDTSMSIEFLVQDKPVVYTDSQDGEECQFMKILLSGYYIAHTGVELLRQLNLLINGEENPVIRDCRSKIVERLMAPLKKQSCGIRAINTIISDVLSK